MKNLFFYPLMIAGFCSSQGYADDSMKEVGPGGKPCAEAISACKAAGFVQGGHKDGKGLHVDCLGKLFKGEAVLGVTVPSDKIAACKDRHEKMMDSHGQKVKKK